MSNNDARLCKYNISSVAPPFNVVPIPLEQIIKCYVFAYQILEISNFLYGLFSIYMTNLSIVFKAINTINNNQCQNN